MAKSNGTGAKGGKPSKPVLSRITVVGFKSIGPERSIEIRPLTLLAGANSSGKSSMMQPLLLLKQTLEAPYDPGALLLDGPNVRFTNFEQMLFRSGHRSSSDGFSVGLDVEGGPSVSVRFRRGHKVPVDVQIMRVDTGEGLFELRQGISEFDPKSWSSSAFREYAKALRQEGFDVKTQIVRHRCFLGKYILKIGKSHEETRTIGEGFTVSAARALDDTIHLPALRGKPERTYPASAAGPRYLGTFENYVASIIVRATDDDPDLLSRICDDLLALGLTWKVTASAIGDTQVELRVGRLPTKPNRGGTHDLVNIADVGFGVSQTLPVVVALAVAQPGQLVYIEQPEIHLHPRAQVAMARLLANAANRGVRVVAETHSSLVLLGVQSLVAEGLLPPEKVKLHWFQRNKDGATEIRSADLDNAGAYGDWPEDFVTTEMAEQRRYARAAHTQLRKKTHGQGSPAQAGG
jgi:hypothetical protein